MSDALLRSADIFFAITIVCRGSIQKKARHIIIGQPQGMVLHDYAIILLSPLQKIFIKSEYTPLPEFWLPVPDNRANDEEQLNHNKWYRRLR